jgi:signal recognition particle subunit SRP54
MAQDFTLDDFRRQLDQVQKMGMKDSLGRVPGLAEMIPAGEDPELSIQRVGQMIDAMTDEERSNPDLIDGDRRRRIAANSGTHPQEVEIFLAQFHEVRALMRRMASMSLWQRIKLVLGFGKLPEQEGEPN